MTYSTDDLRRVYVRATLRAVHARQILAQLEQKCVYLDAKLALDDISSAIYFSANFDAAERFDALASFREELLSEDFRHVPTVQVDGLTCYVLRPVLGDVGVFSHYADGTLARLSLSFGEKFLGKLDESQQDSHNGHLAAAQRSSDVSGLSEMERSFLDEGYRKLAVSRLSALRQLRTALEYTRDASVRQELPKLVVRMDEDIFTLLDAVYQVTEIPLLVPAAKFFSSPGSDGVNIVRKLPDDKATFMEAL